MKLEDTIELMSSDSYEDRFIAEHRQLVIRANNLGGMLAQYKKGELDYKPKCSYGILKTQLGLMLAYISILEERARIENIKL